MRGAKRAGALRLAAAAGLALAVALLVPHPAFASIADDINSWMCGVLRDTCNWIFAAQARVLASIGVEGVLSKPFSSMLGTAGGTTLAEMARGAWQAAVLPIGCGVLSMVFTVQLVHISQRIMTELILCSVLCQIFRLRINIGQCNFSIIICYMYF